MYLEGTQGGDQDPAARPKYRSPRMTGLRRRHYRQVLRVCSVGLPFDDREAADPLGACTVQPDPLRLAHAILLVLLALDEHDLGNEAAKGPGATAGF